MQSDGDIRRIRLAQAGGLQDRVYNFVRSEGIDGNREVSSAVEREAALVAAGQVGLVGEDGAGVLSAAAAGEGGGQFDLQMDQERAGRVEQQGARGGVLDGAAAQGENQRVAGGQAGDGGMLAVAEWSLAVAGEEFRDSGAGLGLD